jgi:hypothetical protein
VPSQKELDEVGEVLVILNKEQADSGLFIHVTAP